MEIQDLLITKEPWFNEYRQLAVTSPVVQSLWTPAIGDWMERLYTLSMEPIIHKEEYAIEMLCYKSTAKGYWHVTSADGHSRLWDSEGRIAKETCKWIPRLDQLLMPCIHPKTGLVLNRDLWALQGNVGEIHLQAMKMFVKEIEHVHMD